MVVARATRLLGPNPGFHTQYLPKKRTKAMSTQEYYDFSWIQHPSTILRPRPSSSDRKVKNSDVVIARCDSALPTPMRKAVLIIRIQNLSRNYANTSEKVAGNHTSPAYTTTSTA